MAAVHFAQRIELDQASRVSGGGQTFPRRILALHEALQPMHEPPPQRLAAKERPIFEFETITQREACEEVAAIGQASFLESAPVAGVLEQMRVDLEFDRRRP